MAAYETETGKNRETQLSYCRDQETGKFYLIGIKFNVMLF